MGRNFIVNDENPTWWHLGRIVQIKNTRVWETQDRIGIVQHGDSSEESRTDYHRLKTMVKRSIEQDIRNKNFGARNGNYERNAVVKNQGTKQRVQRILGECWQWETNGQCSKRRQLQFPSRYQLAFKIDTAESFSEIFYAARVWKMHRELEVPEERVPVVECLDGHARITSKELAPIHSVKSGTLQKRGNPLFAVKRATSAADLLCTTHQIHDNWVAYVKIWSRRSLYRLDGRAQTYWSQSDVFESIKPRYVMLTFETKIHCLEWSAQVILISATPMLQNLRIGLRRRRNGKGDVPAKQRAIWPKMS